MDIAGNTASTPYEIPQLSVGYDRVSAGLGFAFWTALPFVCFLIGGDWVAAGIGLGFISLCLGPFFLYRLCDTREKLRIDQQGITDFRADQRTIRWSQIASCSWRQVTRNGVVSQAHIHLALHDGAEVTVNLTKLDTSIPEVCQAIEQGLRVAEARQYQPLATWRR